MQVVTCTRVSSPLKCHRETTEDGLHEEHATHAHTHSVASFPSPHKLMGKPTSCRSYTAVQLRTSCDTQVRKSGPRDRNPTRPYAKPEGKTNRGRSLSSRTAPVSKVDGETRSRSALYKFLSSEPINQLCSAHSIAKWRECVACI